ncbi:MAG: hypothetical protein AAB507_00585 [Patescibacteria group bacterium]|mgnify:CR=1
MCYTAEPTGQNAIHEEEIKKLFAKSKKKVAPTVVRPVVVAQSDFMASFGTPRFQGGTPREKSAITIPTMMFW